VQLSASLQSKAAREFSVSPCSLIISNTPQINHAGLVNFLMASSDCPKFKPSILLKTWATLHEGAPLIHFMRLA
jgi:hypothetical protein